MQAFGGNVQISTDYDREFCASGTYHLYHKL
jgi:hypothetical protein